MENMFHVLKKITINVEFYSQWNNLPNMQVKYEELIHSILSLNEIPKQ